MADTTWAALLRVHAAVVPILDRTLQASCGLPLTWYDVLQELCRAPDGRLGMGELGERAVVSRTRASRVVDQLAEAGLVARSVDQGDRRSVHASVTGAGRELLRAAEPVHAAVLERYFTGLMSAEETAVVHRALEKVLRGPEAESGPLARALRRQGQTAVAVAGVDEAPREGAKRRRRG